MNFGRVVLIDEDEDELWVEFENGNRVPLPLDEVPEGVGFGDLLYVTENEVRRAPSSSVWRRSPQAIGRLVSLVGDRAMLRVDRSPRIEHASLIESPQLDRFYFYDGDARKWRPLSEDEAGAAEGAEAIDLTINRFEIEHLSPAAGGRAAYGGMGEWFERLRVALAGNFDARAAGDGRDYVSGAIFFGPPGTGKTFLARSVAEEVSASLITVNGPELVDRWFGSTERAMRDLFEFARQHPRSVVFIDEFDSIGPRRGPDVHEAVRRQVGQLLALTDSAARADRPFVIAATNRLEDVDPGFLRAGRFDYKVPFELPQTGERELILRAQAPQLASEVVAWLAGATDGFSAAQLAQIWREAESSRARAGRSVRGLEDVLIGVEIVRAEHSTLVRARERWERERS